MSISVSVGRDNFDKLRRRGRYYVDKTELLYELVHDTDNQVTLFTRPRRFGKTLAMSMMESFFDIRRDSREVFEGLDIMRHEDFCQEWMNQHPVLFVTLKDVEGLRFEKAYAKLQTAIAETCKKHAYLEGSDRVDRDDLELFRGLKAQRASDADVQYSLSTLCRMMHDHFGKSVILLIDEYDVPLAKASEARKADAHYYEEMLDVVRGIMSTALKSNDYLEFAVVTGCLRIAKESIFTGVNNLASYSVLDEDFSSSFGFTQAEVNELLVKAELVEKRDAFREWYDGYIFGDKALYCPWDVMSYASALLKRRNASPKNYWVNSSGNDIIRDFACRREFQVGPKFETLMNGGTLTQTVSDELTYNTLHETEDNLWSVLLMTGYLTKADPEQEGDTVALRIPNKEIASIFQDTVIRLFSDKVDDEAQRSMMDALWAGDEAGASKAISDFLWQTISFNDYHEDYYHAFLAGIFVGRGYTVESNKERGLGRPDIKLIDELNQRALIIEAKKSDNKSQMEEACDEALRQIVDREYAKHLDEYKVTCYGIAFFRKSALAKKLK